MEGRVNPGERYGKWTTIRHVGKAGRDVTWECRCDCGTVKVCRANHLRSGGSKQCRRCANDAHTKHGHSPKNGRKTTEANIWTGIIQRCHNSRSPGYKDYGARGVRVCERWRDSFKAFLEDMGERPSGAHSLDRKDNDGDYAPGNCRWATATAQELNKGRRDRRFIDMMNMIEARAL